MSYIKNVWENGDKVTSEKLNNIENGIENVTNKTKVVEKEFKEFEVGQEFPKGYKLTLDNSNGIIPSKVYLFKAFVDSSVYECAVNLIEENKFLISLTHNNNIITEEYTCSPLYELGYNPFDDVIIDVEQWKLVDIYGNNAGLLGIWTETQLTAQEIYDRTKVVEKEFKEFEVGQTFKIGDKLTKDNVQNTNEGTLDHWFYDTTETYAYSINWNVKKQLFSWKLVRVENDEIIDAEYHEPFTFGLGLEDTSLTFKLEEAVDEGEGTGQLGTWTEKQLTAQEVYDNPLKNDVIYNGIYGNYGDLPKLKDGLYELYFSTIAFSEYNAIFRISNGESNGITNLCFSSDDGSLVNGGVKVELVIGIDGQEKSSLGFYDIEADDKVLPEQGATITLTRIL